MCRLNVEDEWFASWNKLSITFIGAFLYVISGSLQPLLMTVVKESGLGDPSCQVYMLFYYLGPALVSVFLCRSSRSSSSESNERSRRWPTRAILTKSALITLMDISAQVMNYTGASLCGPTIFAIIYSSVTIWTAVYSRILLGRILNRSQWTGVFVVFFGLTITAWDSVQLGQGVAIGAALVAVGSSLHGMAYVLLEAIMTRPTPTNGDDQNHHDTETVLDVPTNCALQGIFATLAFFSWQCIYTFPRFHDRIVLPVQASGTSLVDAISVLLAFGGSNFVHALTYFYTLKHFPGGATSAGVMKGLQAVLVFCFTSLVYCGRNGEGREMCFTRIKLLSLLIVLGGVAVFSIGTAKGMNQSHDRDRRQTDRCKRDYAPISDSV